jgi:hypothetical protein
MQQLILRTKYYSNATFYRDRQNSLVLNSATLPNFELGFLKKFDPQKLKFDHLILKLQQ